MQGLIFLLKGFGITFLAFLSGKMYFSSDNFVTFKILLGICGLLGAYVVLRPDEKPAVLWMLSGVLVSLAPLAFCMSFLVFGLSLLWTRYISLSSIIAAFTFPFILAFIFNERVISMLLFSIAVFFIALLVFERNIRLILSKEETIYRFSKNDHESHT